MTLFLRAIEHLKYIPGDTLRSLNRSLEDRTAIGHRYQSQVRSALSQR